MSDREQRRHARLVSQATRDVDRIFERAAGRIARALEARGGEPLMPHDHAGIMAAVDRELALIYGARRGTAGELERAILESTRRARQVAATAALQPTIQALRDIDPATLYRIERSMKRG